MDVYFGTLFDLVLESTRLLESEYPPILSRPDPNPSVELPSKSTQTVDKDLTGSSTEPLVSSAERSDEGYEEIPDSRSSCTTVGTGSWTTGRAGLRQGTAGSRRSSLRCSSRRGGGRKIVIIYE